MYPNTLLHIDGEWRPGEGDRTLQLLNPATEEQIGTVAHASRADLDDALAATARGFALWRERSAFVGSPRAEARTGLQSASRVAATTSSLAT